MEDLQAVNLDDITKQIASSTSPVSVLWQHDDTLAFVARGREHRSEFHTDPVDEVMLVLKGSMDLHYRTSLNEEKVAVVNEGELIYCPAGVAHSPRFSPDSFLLVMERKRTSYESDHFTWYCESCGAQLYETVKHVTDYNADPVSQVTAEFNDSETHRTCDHCGHVTPKPSP